MYNDRNKPRGLPLPARRTLAGARRRRDEEAPLFKRILIGAIWGLFANLLSGMLLVSIVSAIAYFSPDPLGLIFPLALLALLPSNFLGGFVSAKRCGESALACGITTAAMWGTLSLIGALCLFSISPSGYTIWQSLLLHGASFGFCMLGAAAGGIKRPKLRKKRRFG